MRPIKLTVSGLHSFREQQTVDFEKLCEGGVFGIFGPTGSGKSSLLDAMTLALFGKVERAKKNTQGIMNHAENQLSAAFTFELTGQRPIRYCVERSYKRTKDNGMKIGSCRLLKIDGLKTEVLADKERDVTQGIQDILGLTHEDFTRAVVLPQGKFAEFLTLKGADRRKMLQRLFHLEKYGDKLNDKIKIRLTGVNQRINEISAEQQGLGDASKETLQDIKNQYAETSTAVHNSKEELSKKETAFEKIKQRWEWQVELEHHKKQYQKLLEQQTEITEASNSLKQAEMAEKVMPALEEWLNAGKHYEETKRKLKETKDQFEKAAGQEEALYASYEKAKERRRKKEPILLEKRSKWQQAKDIQKELDQKQRDYQEKKRINRELAIEAEEKERELKSRQSIYQKINHELESIQEKLQAVKISPEYRETVGKAITDKQSIAALDQQLLELREEWKRNRGGYLQIEKDLEETHEKHKVVINQLESLVKKYDKVYDQTAACERQAQVTMRFLEQEEAKAEKLLKTAYKQKLSLKLSNDLKAGEPCPVCGSTHHPKPTAADEDLQEHDLELKAAQYREHIQALHKWVNTIEALKMRLENESQRLLEYFPDKPFPVSENNHDEWPDLGDRQDIHLIGNQVKAINQDILALSEETDKKLKEAQSLKQQLSSMQTKIDLYNERQTEIEVKADKLKDTIQSRKDQWQKTYSEIAYDEAVNELKKIQRKDQQAEQLQKAYHQLLKDKEEAGKQIDELRDRAAMIKSQQAENSSMLQLLSQSIEAQLQKLKQLGLEEDRTIDQHLEDLEKELTELKTREEKSYTSWQQAQASRFSVEKAYSNAENNHQNAAERLDRAKVNWENARQNTDFADEQAVLEAHLEDEEKAKIRKSIQDYDAALNQVTNDMKKLKDRLDGEWLTKEMFDEERNAFQQLKNGYERLLEKKASLYQTLSILEEKHERYERLEKEKESYLVKASQLQKLQQVFRGNSFVEFVAEEQLNQVCIDASKRLGDLTRQRYALEVDASLGFVIRDDANGGIRRPVSSLSGGETFLTSLALALSLSAQIQLRGDVPLQFFFLDEGFGTLDQELLETVVTSLEKLHMNQLSIGIISHVPDLRERMPRKLYVEPAEPSGKGSRVRLETL
ncbi:exonuclease SbcC [Scopulibacillus daqui]|uniref:Nuclease SbcCD subunit C n=1 Tax=Scopulibacillus daqui TaxID=1469162 RepID=A0ABS2PXB1_9BACL|nr:SMC family ATPase [Scopulibacillus daqui]MBM7643942.1 exonuclease SbcC [Scopulibacillus daqui]